MVFFFTKKGFRSAYNVMVQGLLFRMMIAHCAVMCPFSVFPALVTLQSVSDELLLSVTVLLLVVGKQPLVVVAVTMADMVFKSAMSRAASRNG